MRIGWLADQVSDAIPGGAELTAAEFAAAAPGDVQIVKCPPGEVIPGLDRYVIHNCVLYTLDELEAAITGDVPVVKYWHDVGPWLRKGVREWLDAKTTPVCCSPLQAEYMGLTEQAEVIPPPVDLARFGAVADLNSRRGIVCVGSWRNYGKAPHRVVEWARSIGNGTFVDFYGDGPFAPEGSVAVPYEQMPKLLATYQTFAFLPIVIEPFGRTVVEAWAAGLDLVINNLVGARHWIEENPAALYSAADDFWQVVLR